MDKKEINPSRTFWFSFFMGVVLVFILLISLGGMDMLMSSSGLLIVAEMCLGCGLLFGTVFGLLSWITKRNQKLNDQDDINQLMREYLEKKLREED